MCDSMKVVLEYDNTNKVVIDAVNTFSSFDDDILEGDRLQSFLINSKQYMIEKSIIVTKEN